MTANFLSKFLSFEQKQRQTWEHGYDIETNVLLVHFKQPEEPNPRSQKS